MTFIWITNFLKHFQLIIRTTQLAFDGAKKIILLFWGDPIFEANDFKFGKYTLLS